MDVLDCAGAKHLGGRLLFLDTCVGKELLVLVDGLIPFECTEEPSIDLMLE